MLDFAATLPRLRKHVGKDLRRADFGRDHVLACAIRLLDRGFFRIGSEQYAVDNESYGLATIRKHHVQLRGDVITFDYPAKSGKRRIRSVVDPEVAVVVRRLKSRRGGAPELLAFLSRRRWYGIRSDDINEYVKLSTGQDFSAKDFRTWNATVLAALALAVTEPIAGSKAGRKRAIARAIDEVAHYLGNTPAVARASYIDPRVFERYEDGLTIDGALAEMGESLEETAIQGPIEEAVIDLIGP
jgi:DNA topoisomerase IB